MQNNASHRPTLPPTMPPDLPNSLTTTDSQRSLPIVPLARQSFIQRWLTGSWQLFTGLLLFALLTTGLVVQMLWKYPLSQLWQASDTLPLAQMVTQLQIVPTMLVAILAGGLLGVISVLLQQLVKNSLASDTTLAVGSGAQLALLLMTLFLPSVGLYGSFWVAFIGALASMGVVFALAATSRMNSLVLILAGLVLNILLAAVASLLLIFYSERALGVMAWGSGALTQNSWGNVYTLLSVVLVTPVLLGLLIKPLTLMSLDDRQAQSLGVPVAFVRFVVITLVAVLTAVVVSRLGMLSFVGLAAASLVNALPIRQISHRLWASFGLGAMLLWLTNNLVVLITHWLEPIMRLNLPVGAFTGILGAPLIIWLILQQSKQQLSTIDTPPNFGIQRRPVSFLAWLVGLIAIIGLALFIAPSPYPMFSKMQWHIIEQFRLARTLSAAATGIMLAAAGVLLQALTRNPMASPEVMGISSGSALGVILAFLASPLLLKVLGLSDSTTASMGLLLVAGLLGGLLVLWLILWLSRRLAPTHLLLVGVAIAALTNGILSLIKLSGDPRLQAMLNWLSGTTYHAQPMSAWILVAVALGLLLSSFLLLKPLQLLSLGESVARSLGVSIKRYETLVLIVVALLSTAATLAIGPLSFVGLMIPHLATTLGATQLSKQLALSTIMGAILMVMADWVGRYVMFPYEIPAGTIAAVIGGLYFLWMMRRGSE